MALVSFVSKQNKLCALVISHSQRWHHWSTTRKARNLIL